MKIELNPAESSNPALFFIKQNSFIKIKANPHPSTHPYFIPFPFPFSHSHQVSSISSFDQQENRMQLSKLSLRFHVGELKLCEGIGFL